VDHVVAVSESSRVDFQQTYGTPAERISTIPIGTEIPREPRTDAARARLAELTGMPTDADVVIHVGSFSPEKNHLWLVEAFAEIETRRPGAHLVLVGDGHLREAVAGRAKELGIDERMHLLGSRADAAELMGGADVMVLPSTIEGIPGVVLAAARGVPAVATDVGGTKEGIRDGESGVLVPLGNQEAFVSAVVRLLNEPERRRVMGLAARAHVERNYNMERIVDAFEALYAGLITKARPALAERSG
jgi:glycosyltransferase involved in cell wall biosynthesis